MGVRMQGLRWKSPTRFRKLLGGGHWRVRARPDPTVAFAALLVLFAVGSLMLVSDSFENLGEIWKGVFGEATGATMDLVVFGIIIGLIAGRRERIREVSRQEETIEDFKKWNSNEARYRIAGAVRRLNRTGRTSIDFVGIELSNFSFRNQDIESIAGSKFYEGDWGVLSSRGSTTLEEVDFSYVDCRGVVFSKFNPWSGLGTSFHQAVFHDCMFAGALLNGAVFKGSKVEWSKEPPRELGHWDEDQRGEPVFIQTYFPPFHSTDLGGVSFAGVAFWNPDFRDASNLEGCNFSGATGLENGMFDSDEVKELVLQAARRSAG